MPEAYSKAALRHFSDAEKLASCGRFDSAAHLIGFAAECAVKHSILELRLTADAPHVHFPQLIETAKRLLRGRSKHSLFTLLERPTFMVGWKIEDRYADDGTVSEKNYRDWRDDAARTMGAAQLRRRK